MHAIWNNEQKYESYFMPGDWYVSGDSAYMDEDGYFWFQGRVDDVIMTSGERVGPFEVESKLIEHPAVAEAGVIGKPDPVRGEIIKAFVALRDGYEPTEELVDEIRQFVKKGLLCPSLLRVKSNSATSFQKHEAEKSCAVCLRHGNWICQQVICLQWKIKKAEGRCLKTAAFLCFERTK